MWSTTVQAAPENSQPSAQIPSQSVPLRLRPRSSRTCGPPCTEQVCDAVLALPGRDRARLDREVEERRERGRPPSNDAGIDRVHLSRIETGKRAPLPRSPRRWAWRRATWCDGGAGAGGHARPRVPRTRTGPEGHHPRHIDLSRGGGTPTLVISTGAARSAAQRRNLPPMGTRFLRSASLRSK